MAHIPSRPSFGRLAVLAPLALLLAGAAAPAAELLVVSTSPSRNVNNVNRQATISISPASRPAGRKDL